MPHRFLSRKIQAIAPSGIRRFFELTLTMPDVISRGVGDPDFATPAVARAAAQAVIGRGETQYTSNRGLPALLEALAEHLHGRYGVRYEPQTELLITTGVSEALQLAALATLDPGDEVLIPEPCFVAYAPVVSFAGGVPVPVPTFAAEGFAPNLALLEAAITPRTKALLLGYPNNPTGAVLDPPVALALAALAERHDLLVYSDEIYDRLVFDTAHICFAALPGMRARTLTLGGFSKDYAMTGWRIGYLGAPPEILAACLKAHQFVMMSAPTIGQHAALAALRHAEPDVQAMLASYDHRRRLVIRALAQMGLPCPTPRGAFYAFPSVAHLTDDAATFCEQLLLEERVAVIPGDGFGPSGAGHFRLCYATALPKLEEALDRMGRFVGQWAAVGV